MRLSDERLDQIALNVLDQKRREIITGEVGQIVLTVETAAALIAEVRALRPVEKAAGEVCASQPGTLWPTRRLGKAGCDAIAGMRCALAGVRALEGKP